MNDRDIMVSIIDNDVLRERSHLKVLIEIPRERVFLEPDLLRNMLQEIVKSFTEPEVSSGDV